MEQFVALLSLRFLLTYHMQFNLSPVVFFAVSLFALSLISTANQCMNSLSVNIVWNYGLSNTTVRANSFNSLE